MKSKNFFLGNKRKREWVKEVIRAFGFLILGFFFAGIVTGTTAGTNYLVFNFEEATDIVLLSSVKLVEDIKPYEETILGERAGEVIAEGRLVDASGNTLRAVQILDGENVVLFDDRALALQLYQKGLLVQEASLSFCNFNGVCEPCIAQACTVSEHAATCSDCASGGVDYYCDVRKDGICDPDCAGRFDKDCRTCALDCVDEVSGRIKQYCSERNGTVCYFGEGCFGTWVNTLDKQGKCCTGECGDPESLAEWYYAKEVLPQYIVKQPVLRTFDEEESKLTEFFDALGNPIKVYIPEEFEVSYGERDLVAQDISAQEVTPLVSEAEAKEQQFIEAVAAEEVKANVRREVDATIAQQLKEDAREKFYERLRGFNPVTFAGVLLGIVLLLAVGVWAFNRNAEAVATLTLQRAPMQEAAPSTEERVLQLIEDLRKKGYSHEQLREWLVQQGYPVEIVDKQINISREKERVSSGTNALSTVRG